jgi:hypothetical protein
LALYWQKLCVCI